MDFREKLVINDYVKYNEFLKELKEKYCYTEDILTIIQVVLPSIVQYYGQEYEDIILDTLRTTKIIQAKNYETIYDVLKKNEKQNNQIIGDEMVKEGELKRASGVYQSTPCFSISENEVELKGRDRTIGIKQWPDSMRIEELVTFVHELGHAIKGHEKEFELQNNEKGEQILVERSGLAYNTYKVTLQQGMVVMEVLDERNLGLEEGINTLDEEEIINNILFRKEQDTHLLPENCRDYLEKVKTKGEKEPYKVTGYVLQKVFSERIMYDLGLKKAIKKDQLEGKNTIEAKYNERFIDGENHWRRLNSEIDYSTQLSYDKFANIFNLEEWIKKNGEEEKRNIESIKGEIQQYAKTITAEEILKEDAEQKD